MRRWLTTITAAAAIAAGVHGEIIDRIAVTVGDHVISEQEIIHENQVAAFLNREKPDLSAKARRDAAGRLVKQQLIRQEMDETHYPMPAKSEADPLEKQVVAEYGGEAPYSAALASSGLTRDDVLDQLWWQLTILRFIDYRFRPAVHVPGEAVQAYYDQQVKTWKNEGRTDIPTLEESRDSIEKIITEERVDRALDTWLADETQRRNVRYREDAFQ